MKRQILTISTGLLVTLAIVVGTVVLVFTPNASNEDDPWAHVPVRSEDTDHTFLVEGPFATGPDVTAECLTCHEDAGHEMLSSVHWTWQSAPTEVSWSDEPVSIGKANTINNFCIGVQSNWTGCTRCHTGYGWDSADFDFTDYGNVDCLVCHDQTGTYVKAAAGHPAEGVDLLNIAQNVGTPTRINCGGCHFNGGGGNGVKHGDLDESLYFPTANVDVHMGEHNFLCVDCHRTEDHQIGGRALSVSVSDENSIGCTDCHSETLHDDDRINAHVDTVACQTCHVPAGALRDPTKMHWDWSAAGDLEREEDPHEYLAIKGEFVYEDNFMPEYDWFNGEVLRYQLGDLIVVGDTTVLNDPLGDINDPTAQIRPFKIHRALQPYDVTYEYLLQPNTVGETGFWTTFDWPSALQIGSDISGLPFSGNYGFAPTEMYWPLTHMVQPAEYALQCTDCHSDNGRMDWEALGYMGDPMTWGGRDREMAD